MTTTLATPARPSIPSRGTPGLRLIHGELRKIFTTNAWWIFGLGSLAITGLFLWGNLAQADGVLTEARNTSATFEQQVQQVQGPPGQPDAQIPPDELARMKAEFLAAHDLHGQIIKQATNIYTSGQFLGMMLVLLLGVLIVTNEYQHQTATATFLTTPRRTRVIIGKLVAGIGLGALFALVTMLVSLVAGLIFFNQEGLANGLGEWPVTRAMLLDLAGYLLWAVLGIGLGTLIRSQIGSVVLSLVLYLVGYIGSLAAFFMIYSLLLHRDWVLSGAVISPSVASQVMISAEPPYPNAPAWWVGALAMVGWGIVSGGVGMLIMRKRDIS